MIKKEIEKALNDQITREIYSSLLYLSMAGYYQSQNLNGFANWMFVQSKEEMDHAMKMYNFLLNRGGKTKIGKIDEIQNEWSSALEAFESALKHERYITENINNLADLAIKEKDYATNNLMQFFINEQVEEESQVEDIVNRMKMMEGFKGGLMMMDAELNKRQYTSLTTN